MKPQLFVPLVTYPDANSEAVAASTVALAQQLGGDLNAVVFNVDIPDVTNVLSRLLMDLPEMIRLAETRSRERGEGLLKAFVKAAEARKVTLSTDRKIGGVALLGELAAEYARYFDLSAIGWEANNPTSQQTAEAVVFGSGRPALLLPEEAKIGPLKRIAIAWDGSRVAARAVADAIPLLHQAESIHVLTVPDEKPLKEKQAGERLAHHLRRNGLAVLAAAIVAEDRPIAVTLQEHALGLKADLLVMGGYGHSRVRDFVLGGATRGVLEELRLPVLMSH